MAIKKRIFGVAFIITVVLLSGILFSNVLLNDKREDVVLERMNAMIKEYEEMQTLFFLSEYFGEESTCLALESMLSSMNKDLWDLGVQIDEYRQASEEFTRSPFYVDQKKTFNQRAVLYFSMLKRLKDMCNVDQAVVTFLYKNSEDCPRCDQQSFVLSDIRHDLEKEKRGSELALFSFDVDLNLPSIDLLVKFYNVTEYPCVIIEDTPFCGLHDKNEMKEIICNNASLCY
jgi:hypothetical protein